MEIASFQTHHFDAVRQIYLASRIATFTWLDTSTYELSNFERDTQGEAVWVAVECDEVVGFVSVWEADCFVHHLFVGPDKLNKGIGSTLLSFVKRRYSSLSLKCLIQNSHAVAFYLSQGFEIKETVDNGSESYHLMYFIEQT